MTRTIIIRRDYLVRPRWPGSCHSTRRGAGADLLPRAHPSTSSRSTRGTRSATATSLPTARPPSASRSVTTSPSASAALSRRRSASTSSASPRCVARSLEGSPCSRLQDFHVGGSERMHCAVYTRLQVCARCGVSGCRPETQVKSQTARRAGDTERGLGPGTSDSGGDLRRGSRRGFLRGAGGGRAGSLRLSHPLRRRLRGTGPGETWVRDLGPRSGSDLSANPRLTPFASPNTEPRGC
jgi:hypothetical protein